MMSREITMCMTKRCWEIIQALEAWRHYLEGAKHEIDIWTDHQNLKYFMTAKKLNPLTGALGAVSLTI